MMIKPLAEADQNILLNIAREALIHAVHGHLLPDVDLDTLPPSLSQDGASFVTLTISGRLRGCIGTLEAYQPLAQDVQEHAVAAGLYDPRFPQVTPDEIPEISIEVSVLTPRQPLSYEKPQELLEKIKVGVDGVVFVDGYRKATFLPQVWDKLPEPAQFFSHLCLKMGSPADLWREKKLDVYTYQVQEFHEKQAL